MSQVELTEAAADLAALVARARGGEEVVIVESGRAIEKLVAVEQSRRVHQPVQLGRLDGISRVPDCVDAPRPTPRRLGVAEGKFNIPTDFDASLPDDLLDLFYNGPLFPSDPKAASASPHGQDDGRDETPDGS